MTLITSRQNSKIKLIRSLEKRKQRTIQGVFVVEGIRHVGEAVESNAEIEFVMYAPDLLESDYAYQDDQATGDHRDSSCPDDRGNLLRSCRQGTSPGFSGGCQTAAQIAEHTDFRKLPFAVAIESPQDPGNLGTILRTLDAAGADALIQIDGGTDIFHPTAVRASMGAMFWRPVVTSSLAEFSAWAKVQKVEVVGSSARGEGGLPRNRLSLSGGADAGD